MSNEPAVNCRVFTISGWRKWAIVLVAILISTALLFFNQPNGSGGWVPILTGAEWIWFVIRIVFLYLVGNVGANLSDKFFSK